MKNLWPWLTEPVPALRAARLPTDIHNANGHLHHQTATPPAQSASNKKNTPPLR